MEAESAEAEVGPGAARGKPRAREHAAGQVYWRRWCQGGAYLKEPGLQAGPQQVDQAVGTGSVVRQGLSPGGHGGGPGPERMRELRRVGTAGQDALTSDSAQLAAPSSWTRPTGSREQQPYDFESPNLSVPAASCVGDVTLGEEASVAPDAQFLKPWQMENSRAEAWPPRAMSGETRLDV